MKKPALKYIIYFLTLFYLVGAAGFIFPETRTLFSKITPFALLLNVAFLAWFHHPKPDTKTVIFFTAIFLISFIVEMAGVQTGWIFGEYNYAEGLGIKVFETPLIIGINWLMLVYCTKIIADYLPAWKITKTIMAASLMVLYDLILEQVAPHLKMWVWKDDAIPLQNFGAWFLLALIFQSLAYALKIRFSNKLAAPVFIIQTLFFVFLMIYYSATSL